MTHFEQMHIKRSLGCGLDRESKWRNSEFRTSDVESWSRIRPYHIRTRAKRCHIRCSALDVKGIGPFVGRGIALWESDRFADSVSPDPWL